MTKEEQLRVLLDASAAADAAVGYLARFLARNPEHDEALRPAFTAVLAVSEALVLAGVVPVHGAAHKDFSKTAAARDATAALSIAASARRKAARVDYDTLLASGATRTQALHRTSRLHHCAISTLRQWLKPGSRQEDAESQD